MNRGTVKTLGPVLAVCLLAAALFAGCGAKKKETVPSAERAVMHETEFGGVYIDITIDDFNALGFAYGDSVNVTFSNGYEMKEHTEKTVLLSPTWGPNSILVKFGSPFIDRLIETGYNIIIRPHPQSYTADKDTIETLMAKYPETEKLHWNRDNDNFDVLASADIMISDYSGVMYDFIFIFNKPVIYTTEGFKKDPYDAWCLEGETWMISTIRKLGKELTKENAENIRELIDTSIEEGLDPVEVEQARIETWCNVGKSSSLIAEYIIDKYAGIEAEQQAKEKEAEK